MSLKEQISEDLTLFFDLEECAQEHEFAGRKMLVIIDQGQLQIPSSQDRRGGRVSRGVGGIFEGDLLLFIRTDDLKGLRIHPQRSVEFDRKPYCVISSSDQDGITQIVLQAWEGI